MSDTLGRIPVASVVLSVAALGEPVGISGTAVFPLVTEFGFGFSQDRTEITHRMGSLDAKQEQRYFAGLGPRKCTFLRKSQSLTWKDGRALKAFWEEMQGPWKAFTYIVPNADGSTTSVLVTFENTPISFDYLRNSTSVGFNLVEVVDPGATPTVYSDVTAYALLDLVSFGGLSYTCIQAGTGDQPDISPLFWTPSGLAIASTCTRFPSSALSAALLAEVQEIIPLLHIRVRESAVPDIYLSDRRVTVGGQLYLPRLVSIGEPGSDVLISQDIKGSSDAVKFAFGNADRAMTKLSNDTDLKYAVIDFCLFHVNSGILIQTWKGVIQTFSSDPASVFPITCSDGFFQIMNQYPERSNSRQCWKTLNDGLPPTDLTAINCPFATKGALDLVNFPSASAGSCDYYLESANGCQAHGMSKYFGAMQADPQGVTIKDNSTGFLGFGRNSINATSIVTDTIWGLALAEIYCNSGGNPLYAFMANALMVDYRDESSYSDALGILGAGPLGGFTQSAVVTNADGFRYVVAPMVDGFTWQGFRVNGNLNVTKNQPGFGLRQVQGNDPANPASDSFSLGSGGGQDSNGNPVPSVYEPNNFAAGTAFCEIRIVKPAGITPSTPDEHQMTVPIDYGLSGWTWDASGTRTAVRGLINPFWIVVNMLLRATGLSGNITVPLDLTSVVVTLPAQTFFGSTGAQVIGTVLLVSVALGGITAPLALIAGLVILIGSAFTGNAFSVPMSNAANQAEMIMQQNVQQWQNLSAVDQTTANRTIFLNNWTVIWNAYVAACTTIFQGNPNSSDAKKALNRSIADRISGGKYDWVAYYYTPISSSATPGDTITTPSNSAAQLEMFVLPSLFVGDGSGTAEIAAAQVAKILGTGLETQFQFQGVISSQKPFRDWLTEVLNCCLGFYTWEFGKLKLGCRVNASAVDDYGIGNTLFQSLRLAPIAAAYEKTVLSYADVAYQYQANTAEYCDKSHAAYYGRQGSPLTTQRHSVGCSTLSQGLRLAATTTREEIGGVNPTEWRDARTVSWQTTLLGLGNEVGQVVSQTHPEIPGLHGTCDVSGSTVTWDTGDDWDDSIYTNPGAGAPTSSLLDKDVLINGTQVTITAVTISSGTVVSLTVTPPPGNGTGLSFQVITMSFRIQRWSLKKDWSVQIEGQTVTGSMYDLDVGPKPLDVLPGPLPVLFTPIPLGPAWAPYEIQAQSWDALFPSEYNFDSNQTYRVRADFSVSTSLLCTGKQPVNEFSVTGAVGPTIGKISQSTTGGTLPANSTLIVSLVAIDGAGLPSAPARIAIIGTSDSGTDTFTLDNIIWPAVGGLASYVLFISLEEDLICAQATGSLTPTGGGTTYTPGSITFGAAIQRSTWALPSPYVKLVRVKCKLGWHLGILGVLIDSVTSNTITCADLVDTSGTPPNLVGRAFSCIGRNGSNTPWLSVTITAYVPSTGTITVSPQAVVSGQPMQSFASGDIGIVRMKCDEPNYLNLTQVTDAGWSNSQSAYLGLNTSEITQVLRVIAGTSRGETRKVTGIVTAVGGTVPTGWSWGKPLLLDNTSVWIIEQPTWIYGAESTALPNSDYLHETVLQVAADNFVNQQIIVVGFTVDINGAESPDADCPVREDWIYGTTAITVDTTATIPQGYSQVWVDASAGGFTITLPAIDSLVQPITLTRTDTTTNVVTVVSPGSTFFGAASVSLDNAAIVSFTVYHEDL